MIMGYSTLNANDLLLPRKSNSKMSKVHFIHLKKNFFLNSVQLYLKILSSFPTTQAKCT